MSTPEWFIKSENREPGYENYYIWHPGTFNPVTGMRIPPNNWPSVFRFSAWKWSPKRKQFYYHAFLDKQPDLNYRNRKIVQEMKDVITFWISRRVQGFRIDAVPFMFEVKPDSHGNIPDEPLTGDSCPNPDDPCYTNHIYMQDRPETWDMIFQWRSLMDDFAKTHDNVTKVIMTEAYTSLENMIKYYGDGRRNGSHVPFNFEMISNVNINSTAKDFKLRIDNWLSRVPAGKHANWVVCHVDKCSFNSSDFNSHSFSWAIMISIAWPPDWELNVPTFLTSCFKPFLESPSLIKAKRWAS